MRCFNFNLVYNKTMHRRGKINIPRFEHTITKIVVGGFMYAAEHNIARLREHRGHTQLFIRQLEKIGKQAIEKRYSFSTFYSNFKRIGFLQHLTFERIEKTALYAKCNESEYADVAINIFSILVQLQLNHSKFCRSILKEDEKFFVKLLTQQRGGRREIEAFNYVIQLIDDYFDLSNVGHGYVENYIEEFDSVYYNCTLTPRQKHLLAQVVLL